MLRSPRMSVQPIGIERKASKDTQPSQEEKLVESKVPPVASEPKFVEAVCNSLVAHLHSTERLEAEDVQHEIATIKKGVACLANRCEEILEITKELARELDIERSTRETSIEAVHEQYRKHFIDFEQHITQSGKEQSHRLEYEFASIRVAVDAARAEISEVNDNVGNDIQACAEEIASMRTIVLPGQNSTRQPSNSVRESCDDSIASEASDHSARPLSAQLAQRSWEEEVASIRAHMRRFQDTFSKSLSFERESRQRDMNMLLSTIGKCKQAVAESAGSVSLPPEGHDDRQKISRTPYEQHAGASTMISEVVTLR